jgi:hypothetical protein
LARSFLRNMSASWTPDRLKGLAEDVGSGVQFLADQLEQHKKIVSSQKEIMHTQDKRIAELEVLVKKRPPQDDETTQVLKELDDAMKKVRENHERRKRRHGRFVVDVTAGPLSPLLPPLTSEKPE